MSGRNDGGDQPDTANNGATLAKITAGSALTPGWMNEVPGSHSPLVAQELHIGRNRYCGMKPPGGRSAASKK
jgi:hypothetical protein